MSKHVVYENTQTPLHFGCSILIAMSQAGNVVTGEMVEELILSGADIIKVGIGPGKPLVTSLVAANICEALHFHLCHVLCQALCVQPGRKLEWGTHSSVQ